jgi:hypothetical protein
MGFNTNTVRSITPSFDGKKATGFLNVCLRNEDGTPGRVISGKGLFLYEDKAMDRATIARIESGGEEALTALAAKVCFTWVRSDREVAASAVGF